MARNDGFSKSEDMQQHLHEMLLAYALRSVGDDVGYSQSMNYLGGLLLLVTGRPETAFGLLGCLVEDVLPAGLYSRSSMAAVQAEVAVFIDIVIGCKAFQCIGAGKALLEHLGCLGCPIESVVLPWFSCLFVNALPWASVLRIWDLLLLPVTATVGSTSRLDRLRSSGQAGLAAGGGGSAVLHRAALAILLRLEEQLRSCVAIEQAYHIFGKGGEVRVMHDEHELAAMMMDDKALKGAVPGPAELEERRARAMELYAPRPKPAPAPAVAAPQVATAAVVVPDAATLPPPMVEQERERPPRSKGAMRAAVSGLSEEGRSAALVGMLDEVAMAGDDAALSALMELLNETVAQREAAARETGVVPAPEQEPEPELALEIAPESQPELEPEPEMEPEPEPEPELEASAEPEPDASAAAAPPLPRLVADGAGGGGTNWS